MTGNDTLKTHMPGKKLLVADDSLTIQKVIRLSLSNEGYDIHSASDGNHALQQIATFRPDIVLIDVSLPGKSAFEVKREINGTDDSDEIKFVLMSTESEHVDETQFEEVSFHGRLTKPFDPAQLRQILIDAIHFPASQQKSKIFDLPPFPIVPDGSDHHSETMPELDSELELREDIPLKSHHDSLEDSFADFEIREAVADPLITPIEPSEIPPLPSLNIESVSELWEVNNGPEPQISLQTQGPESDIRQLAEITLTPKSSDEFEWNIHENLPSFDFAGTEPALPVQKFVPPPPTEPRLPVQRFEPAPAPAAPVIPPPFKTVAIDPMSSEHPAAAEAFPQKKEEMPQPQVNSFKPEELEKIIQEQVRASLEKMAKSLLPSIAERIIKEEIHRLLTDTEAHPS